MRLFVQFWLLIFCKCMRTRQFNLPERFLLAKTKKPIHPVCARVIGIIGQQRLQHCHTHTEQLGLRFTCQDYEGNRHREDEFFGRCSILQVAGLYKYRRYINFRLNKHGNPHTSRYRDTHTHTHTLSLSLSLSKHKRALLKVNSVQVYSGMHAAELTYPSGPKTEQSRPTCGGFSAKCSCRI